MELKPLDTGNLLTIIGWVVSFSFGLLSATIVQRRGRSRKVLSWSLLSESDLLSRETLRELETGFGVPVTVSIQGRQEVDLSTVRVRVTNSGNTELQNVTLYFKFGTDAQVHVGRYIGDLGIYRRKLKLEKFGDTATLEISHINPAQEFEVEFLVTHHVHAQFTVDMAEPGVILRRVAPDALQVPRGVLASMALSVFGIRYDPSVQQTARLVEEVKRLTATIERVSKK